MDQPPLRAVSTRPEVEVYTLRCKGDLEGVWRLRAKTRQDSPAIQWVSRHWYTAGRPVCVRYSNAYGAMIASGTWKAKKHKAMAAEARAAWKALKRKIGGQAVAAPRREARRASVSGRAGHTCSRDEGSKASARRLSTGDGNYSAQPSRPPPDRRGAQAPGSGGADPPRRGRY